MGRNNWCKKILMMGTCGLLMIGMTACKDVVKEPMITQTPTASEDTNEISQGELVEEMETASIEVSSTEETAMEISTTGEFVTENTVVETIVETSVTDSSATMVPGTEASTTEALTTEAPTTEASTTEAPATEASTTEAPTTEAPTTEAPTTEAPTVQSIKAVVKGNYYVGDTLSASDFTITITMSDGSTRKNPAGWSADKLYLDGQVNEINVTYQGVSTTITVYASERPVETEAPTKEPTTEVAPQPPVQEPGSSDDGMSLRRDAAEEAFRIQNDLIVQNGGTPLIWSETFYQQACQRAKDIVTNFSHDGFYDTTAYAENIAMGSYDANVMVQAWYNSDGHRNNMLHGWTYGAIACYGNHWVALFGPNAG